MPLLDQEARDQITELFEKLESPVKLVFYTMATSKLFVPGQDQPTCESCDDEQQLLTELTELSDKLELEIHDVRQEPDIAREAGVDRVPALILRGPADKGTVRFFGLPAGYEFSTLVMDIVDVSTSNVELTEKTQAALKALTEPVHLQVFVTPT